MAVLLHVLSVVNGAFCHCVSGTVQVVINTRTRFVQMVDDSASRSAIVGLKNKSQKFSWCFTCHGDLRKPFGNHCFKVRYRYKLVFNWLNKRSNLVYDVSVELWNSRGRHLDTICEADAPSRIVKRCRRPVFRT